MTANHPNASDCDTNSKGEQFHYSGHLQGVKIYLVHTLLCQTFLKVSGHIFIHLQACFPLIVASGSSLILAKQFHKDLSVVEDKKWRTFYQPLSLKHYGTEEHINHPFCCYLISVCQMICHLLLFMKLFPKKLPYLFYAIKEGKKRKIHDLEDNEMQLVRTILNWKGVTFFRRHEKNTSILCAVIEHWALIHCICF